MSKEFKREIIREDRSSAYPRKPPGT